MCRICLKIMTHLSLSMKQMMLFSPPRAFVFYQEQWWLYHEQLCFCHVETCSGGINILFKLHKHKLRVYNQAIYQYQTPFLGDFGTHTLGVYPFRCPFPTCKNWPTARVQLLCNYPLVNVDITMENGHFSWGNPVKMVIFQFANC